MSIHDRAMTPPRGASVSALRVAFQRPWAGRGPLDLATSQALRDPRPAQGR